MSTLSSPLFRADQTHGPIALPRSHTQVHTALSEPSRGFTLSDHLEVTGEIFPCTSKNGFTLFETFVMIVTMGEKITFSSSEPETKRHIFKSCKTEEESKSMSGLWVTELESGRCKPRGKQ